MLPSMKGKSQLALLSLDETPSTRYLSPFFRLATPHRTTLTSPETRRSDLQRWSATSKLSSSPSFPSADEKPSWNDWQPKALARAFPSSCISQRTCLSFTSTHSCSGLSFTWHDVSRLRRVNDRVVRGFQSFVIMNPAFRTTGMHTKFNPIQPNFHTCSGRSDPITRFSNTTWWTTREKKKKKRKEKGDWLMEAMLKKGCEWAEGRREKKAIDERYDEMRHDVMN